MDQSAWGITIVSILFTLFTALIIWIERGRARQKADAREEAKKLLESGRIDDIEYFEYICRVLFITKTSVLNKGTEAADLYRRLQDLWRANSKDTTI